MSRLIAVGDIHGHFELLVALLAKIAPRPDDQLVFLGDYIDRGPDTPAVLDLFIRFKRQFPRTIFLRGNHEQMLLDAIGAAEQKGNGKNNWLNDFFLKQINGLPAAIYFFVSCGGRETLSAYDAKQSAIDPCRVLSELPQAHLDFIRQTRFFFHYQQFMFVHAGVDPDDITGRKTDNRTFLWERSPLWKADKRWDKVVVHGHTPVAVPYFDRLEINLDTGAGYNGSLTACDVLTQELWQVAPNIL